ncbi:serine/threonine protein kinase [Actinomadura flavalba]|uniref:serine/threonine protein kinase n=1 Tax=Actinomadura flavalba TaxID=1120938 RepID=UPI00039FC9FA|nr:serine/threonine-protein kinase [Actinomadura flavalba]
MTESSIPDTHPLRPGDPGRLGAYELVGRLGEGGQGAVFLGRRAGAAADDLANHVAIKLLHADLTGDTSARSRFVRELAVAKQVARFCTAQVLDADVAGDHPYIVSEYVPGKSLHRVVQQDGPRTGGALERLAISTLTALIAIHQAGIVHRDFKPHNVMMGPDGPRVIDFGVARALGAAGETQNVGTPAYMAPEHFTAGPVGPAADMFAWGTTMVFAATGQPAFGNDDLAAVMHRILTGEPQLGALPEPLRDLVLACLAKDPARRPGAREAQERLMGAASGIGPRYQALPPPPPPFAAAPAHPVNATNPATMPQPGQVGAVPSRGPRVALPVTAAALLVALIAGGAVWAANRPGGEPERRQAAVEQEAAAEDGRAGAAGGAPGTSKKPTPSASRKTTPATTPGAPKARPERPGASTPPAGDGRPPTGTPAPTRPAPRPEPANRYTPQAACNSGGHGGGYYVQRSVAGSGGTAYLLYNGSGYNCAVTMKTKNVGKKTNVSVWVQRQGGSRISDGGAFAWYAGPVYVKAPGTCVRFGGNGASAPYGNCG